jgi:hypothetical protein
MRNEFTKAQLQWMVRMFAKGGSVQFSPEHDKRELRPLNTLVKQKLLKVRENRSAISYAVTPRGRKVASA